MVASRFGVTELWEFPKSGPPIENPPLEYPQFVEAATSGPQGTKLRLPEATSSLSQLHTARRPRPPAAASAKALRPRRRLGSLYQLRVLFVGVLTIRTLLVAPDSSHFFLAGLLSTWVLDPPCYGGDVS